MTEVPSGYELTDKEIYGEFVAVDGDGNRLSPSDVLVKVEADVVGRSQVRVILARDLVVDGEILGAEIYKLNGEMFEELFEQHGVVLGVLDEVELGDDYRAMVDREIALAADDKPHDRNFELIRNKVTLGMGEQFVLYRVEGDELSREVTIKFIGGDMTRINLRDGVGLIEDAGNGPMWVIEDRGRLVFVGVGDEGGENKAVVLTTKQESFRRLIKIQAEKRWPWMTEDEFAANEEVVRDRLSYLEDRRAAKVLEATGIWLDPQATIHLSNVRSYGYLVEDSKRYFEGKGETCDLEKMTARERRLMVLRYQAELEPVLNAVFLERAAMEQEVFGRVVTRVSARALLEQDALASHATLREKPSVLASVFGSSEIHSMFSLSRAERGVVYRALVYSHEAYHMTGLVKAKELDRLKEKFDYEEIFNVALARVEVGRLADKGQGEFLEVFRKSGRRYDVSADRVDMGGAGALYRAYVELVEAAKAGKLYKSWFRKYSADDVLKSLMMTGYARRLREKIDLGGVQGEGFGSIYDRFKGKKGAFEEMVGKSRDSEYRELRSMAIGEKDEPKKESGYVKIWQTLDTITERIRINKGVYLDLINRKMEVR